MNGYTLIWILLQKIQELEKELESYKKNTNKNWFISSERSITRSVFFKNKKRYVPSHTYLVLCLMIGYFLFKLFLL